MILSKCHPQRTKRKRGLNIMYLLLFWPLSTYFKSFLPLLNTLLLLSNITTLSSYQIWLLVACIFLCDIGVLQFLIYTFTSIIIRREDSYPVYFSSTLICNPLRYVTYQTKALFLSWINHLCIHTDAKCIFIVRKE